MSRPKMDTPKITLDMIFFQKTRNPTGFGAEKNTSINLDLLKTNGCHINISTFVHMGKYRLLFINPMGRRNQTTQLPRKTIEIKFQEKDNYCCTPPKFISSPLKNGGWKTTYLLGRELFRGELLNFGRVALLSSLEGGLFFIDLPPFLFR